MSLTIRHDVPNIGLLPLNDLTDGTYVVPSIETTTKDIWRVFDHLLGYSTYALWHDGDVNDLTIDYDVYNKLGYSPVINKLNIKFTSEFQTHKQSQISGSDDNINWVGIAEEPAPSEALERDFSFSNTTSYKWYRLKFKEGQFRDGASFTSIGVNLGIHEIKYYDTTILTQEEFVGSLTRDTAYGAGDFVQEVIEETLDLDPPPPISLQTGYEFTEGWNMFSWPWPYDQNIEEAFTLILGHVPTVNDIQIIKNNAADVYWPEYGFNGIGDIISGQGYQIKLLPGSPLIGIFDPPMLESKKSEITTRNVLKTLLNATSIDYLSGWNMIGTNRLESINVIDAFNHMNFVFDGIQYIDVDITDDIQIVKDNNGNVYWPEYGFDGIGNFNPGQGYQVRTFQAFSQLQFAPHVVTELESIPLIDQ